MAGGLMAVKSTGFTREKLVDNTLFTTLIELNGLFVVTERTVGAR